MSHDSLPLVQPLASGLDSVDVFRRLARQPHCVFLDSAARHRQRGRYSFVAADPFDYFTVPTDGRDGLALLAQRLSPWKTARRPDLPPFQGGAAGLLSYDLGRSLERLPAPRYDEFGLPAIAIGLYDLVVAFDHETAEAWAISQGYPARDDAARLRRAAERLAQLEAWLAQPPAETSSLNPRDAIAAQRLAPQFAVPSGRAHGPRLTSNFSASAYLEAVARVKEYIAAGDVFQVNLAQRLLTPALSDSIRLYTALRACNPAPFAGYFDLGASQVLSASPERFMQVAEGVVETRPIKGTRRRTGRQRDDACTAAELQSCAKDRAENIMIVDLLRNDLARACQADSVCVAELCAVEHFQYVMHLVSAVRGKLRQGCGPIELLRASFPGGSITGAPKVRAMQIIAELEPTARGAYCGALGYIGFDGAADFNILIRTITAAGGWWQLPVGGGIVTASQGEREYEETWEKAEGLLRAVQAAAPLANPAEGPAA